MPQPSGYLPVRRVRITVYLVNNEEHSIVVDAVDNADGYRPLVRTFEEEGHTVLHFGRTESGQWQELTAYPREQVVRWQST